MIEILDLQNMKLYIPQTKHVHRNNRSDYGPVGTNNFIILIFEIF